MHRIDTPTAQKDKFGTGRNRLIRGNRQTGTPANDLDDAYFDMLQKERVGVVEATGASLDKFTGISVNSGQQHHRLYANVGIGKWKGLNMNRC